jgi:hypothetical protein
VSKAMPCRRSTQCRRERPLKPVAGGFQTCERLFGAQRFDRLDITAIPADPLLGAGPGARFVIICRVAARQVSTPEHRIAPRAHSRVKRPRGFVAAAPRALHYAAEAPAWDRCASRSAPGTSLAACGTAMWPSNRSLMPTAVFWKVFPTESSTRPSKHAIQTSGRGLPGGSSSRIAWRPAQKLEERGSRKA